MQGQRRFVITVGAVLATAALAVSYDFAASHPARSAKSGRSAPKPIALEALPNLALELKAQSAVSSQSELEAVQREVAEAAKDLDRYLSRGGRKYQSDWQTYLRWDDLQPVLRSQLDSDVERLLGVRRQLRKGHEGLDMPIFRRLSDRLGRLTARMRRTDPNVAQEYATRLDEISALLAPGAEPLAGERLQRLGASIHWLEERGLGGNFAGAVRHHYWRPNLLLQVSEKMMADALVSKIDSVNAIDDMILGTYITGTGHTTGTVTASLIPNSKQATIETRFRGRTHSDTMGSNGPARIFTQAVTHIRARKRLLFTGSGFDSSPATAEAETHSDTVGIGSTKRGFMDRIVRRVASKRVAQSQWQAEQISAEHAESLFSERFDRDAQKRLDSSNDQYVRKFRRPLKNAGGFPSRLASYTTADELHVTAVQADGSQVAVAGEAPSLAPGFDLGVRVHESMIHNLTTSILAGQTIDDKQMRQWMLDTFGKVPEQFEAKDEEDRQPWSITFAAPEPVTVHFSESEFSVTIRGASYTSGENRYQAMDVTAAYKLQRDGERTRAIRDGELKIYPPGFVQGKDRLAVRQQTLRRLLERRFGKVFGEELQFNDIELSGDWKKIGKLAVKDFQSQGGWLTMGWNRVPTESAAYTSSSRQDVARPSWEPVLISAIMPSLEIHNHEHGR